MEKGRVRQLTVILSSGNEDECDGQEMDAQEWEQQQWQGHTSLDSKELEQYTPDLTVVELCTAISGLWVAETMQKKIIKAKKRKILKA